jgi:hypothetical protein
MHVFPTTYAELLRHTGAGSFVRSSAVGYHRAISWYLIQMLLEFLGGHAKSVWQFLIRFCPRRWIPCVEKGELFATIEPLSYFVSRDSGCFHGCFHHCLHCLVQARRVPYEPADEEANDLPEFFVFFVPFCGCYREIRRFAKCANVPGPGRRSLASVLRSAVAPQTKPKGIAMMNAIRRSSRRFNGIFDYMIAGNDKEFIVVVEDHTECHAF